MSTIISSTIRSSERVSRIGCTLHLELKRRRRASSSRTAFKMATLTSASFRVYASGSTSAARLNDHLSLFDTRECYVKNSANPIVRVIIRAWRLKFAFSRLFSLDWNIYKRVGLHAHAYRIRFGRNCESRLSRSARKLGSNISRSVRADWARAACACPCITDISVQSISRYKGRRSPLCHSRHGQTLANAM